MSDPEVPTVLRGRSIIVSGGGSGIGRAIATLLVDAGAAVTICGRQEGIGELAAGIGCTGVQADVTLADDRVRLLEAARKDGHPIYGLVHCAADLVLGPLSGLTEATAMRLFSNNVVSAMLLTAEALDDLERTRGCAIFFSSAHTRRASANIAAYAATKGAVEAATRALAVELGPRGIRVNCIRPGAVPTQILVRSGAVTADEAATRLAGLADRHALGRLGTPEDVAHAAEFLLTAPWVTGTVLGVDGGLTLGI
jgi:3-oxoacyl-[acyl-carrier protein] reductase